MINSPKRIYTFLSTILELLESGYSLSDALNTLSACCDIRGTSGISDLCNSILNNMKIGFRFSAALSNCLKENIPAHYISLLSACEKDGNLIKGLRFICETEEKKAEVTLKIKEASVYPVIVIVLVIIGTVTLLFNSSLFGFSVLPATAIKGCVIAFFALSLFLGIFKIYIERAMREDFNYTLFYSLEFLLEAGFDVWHSLGFIILYHGTEKEKHAISEIRQKMETGVSVDNAFASTNFFSSDIITRIQIGCKKGALATTCHRIAIMYAKKADARRALCIQMSEPLLLTGVGLYLLIILQFTIMPFITQYGGVL